VKANSTGGRDLSRAIAPSADYAEILFPRLLYLTNRRHSRIFATL
jgi:hypothetical protein